MNGTIEHIFSIDSLVHNARATRNLIAMSFLDLQNAIGSVYSCDLFYNNGDSAQSVDLHTVNLPFLPSCHHSVKLPSILRTMFCLDALLLLIRAHIHGKKNNSVLLVLV